MKLLILILSFTISNSILSQEGTNIILSKKFINRDTLSIQLHYFEQKGCISRDYGRLTIRKKGKNIYVYHRFLGEENHKLKKFLTKDVDFIDKLIELETKAKTTKTHCGGIRGDTGVEINLIIENSKTAFSYCKNKWDGISEFLNKLNLKPF